MGEDGGGLSCLMPSGLYIDERMPNHLSYDLGSEGPNMEVKEARLRGVS